jgi:thiamine-phosphate pyrophosphorylase
MPVHLTPAADRALVAMSAWAERLGHDSTSAIHLLLALLDDEEGRAAQLVAQAGLEVGAAQQVVQSVEPRHSVQTSDAIVALARNISRESASDDECRSEHLLIAILQSEPAIRSALECAGLHGEAVRDAVLAPTGSPLTLDEPLDLSESGESFETARILDASANRAREALRVIEDYCRFVLNDANLCRETKELRHDLVQALAAAMKMPLLAARDTVGDIGVSISTPSEQRRDSALAVAQANLKRLQESLRSLEEFGKIVDAEIGRSIEQIRYRAYTLERAIVRGSSARDRLADCRLYLLITGATCATSLEFLIEEAAANGVDIVQLREKDLNDCELLAKARRVRQLTTKASVLFIVNDRPDIARLAEADGVHLGQEDLPVREARRVMGADALVGVSTHSMDQLRRAVWDGADYLGVGPVFPSKTKSFDEFAGLSFVRQAAAETSLPAFALGGISVQNLSQVLQAGAARVAVGSAICSADEPGNAAFEISRILKSSAVKN